MLASIFIQGVGSTGFFSSRAFMPAFMSALVLVYGPDIEFLDIANAFLFEETEVSEVWWFTSDYAIWILGGLAGLEWLMIHNPDLRAIIIEFDVYPKVAMSVISFVGLFNATDSAIAGKVISQTGMGDWVLALVVGVITLAVARLQRRFKLSLYEADQNDQLGIQRLFYWAEDVWGLFGPWILLIFPFLTLMLVGIVVGLLVLARKRVEIQEEQSKIACAQCGEMIYQSALICSVCQATNKTPHKIGWLGQPKHALVTDIEAHRYRLVEKKRCPVCATRFRKHEVKQECRGCSHQLMATTAFAREYLKRIDRRVPLVLLVSFLLSLVPIIGLIPAVIYYRIKLVAPLRQYIPRTRNMLLRWGVSVFQFILIGFQWIPVFGGFVAPIMGFTSYRMYRLSYEKLLLKSSIPDENVRIQ